MTRRREAHKNVVKWLLVAFVMAAAAVAAEPHQMLSKGLLSVPSAFGYCRTSTCEGDVVGSRCEPALPSDCGLELFWPSHCVGYSVQRDASSQVDLETTRALVAEAFSAWESAACEDGAPTITAEDLGPVSCDQVQYDAETKNANVIVFRDTDWPYGGSAALALTTVTYALETGEIRDADIEINSAEVSLTTADDVVDVDLLSILTHEAGHFLGLAHAPVAAATMNGDYPPSSITLRSLDADDQAGICAIYPPSATGLCDSTPKNGLGDECAEPSPEAEETSCSSRTLANPSIGVASFWLLSAAASLGLLRRRAGSRRRRSRGSAS